LVGVHFGWPTQNPGRKVVFQEGKSEQVTKNGFIVYCDIILVSLNQIKQSQYWNHVHEPLRMLRAANCGWLKSIICIGIYWSYKIIEPYRFGRVAKNIYRWGKQLLPIKYLDPNGTYKVVPPSHNPTLAVHRLWSCTRRVGNRRELWSCLFYNVDSTNLWLCWDKSCRLWLTSWLTLWYFAQG
jgi:hypothetical protein